MADDEQRVREAFKTALEGLQALIGGKVDCADPLRVPMATVLQAFRAEGIEAAEGPRYEADNIWYAQDIMLNGMPFANLSWHAILRETLLESSLARTLKCLHA